MDTAVMLLNMELHTELFATTAQVIPTMAIAIIVEQTVLLPRVKKASRPAYQQLYAVNFAMIVAAIGEFFALRALTWTPVIFDAIAVWGCMTFLSLVLASPIVHQLREAASRQAQKQRKQRRSITVSSVLGAVVSALVGLVGVVTLIIVWLFGR